MYFKNKGNSMQQIMYIIVNRFVIIKPRLVTEISGFRNTNAILYTSIQVTSEC